MQKSKINYGVSFIISCFLIGSIFSSTSVLAAMDPTEINRINSEAPYHIIGKVTLDEFYEDITKEEKHPRQLRKMTMDITDIIKAPKGLEEIDSVEVFYEYMPSWDARNFVGESQMDIAENDVIEIWLVKGDYGWWPTLSGDSVHHISYTENRSEHISEPFWHAIKRNLSDLENIRTDVFVLFGLFIVLMWAIYKGIRKTA